MMVRFSWLYVSLFLLFLSTSVSSSSLSSPPLASASPLCHNEERRALLQFKMSFSIHDAISWENGRDCCAWNEVTCDTITGHVIGLNVSSGGLDGMLYSNSSLFQLLHLQTLDLSWNDFRGSRIPAEFGKFAHLLDLQIRYANFSGHIPPEISYLSNLQTFSLFADSAQQLRLNAFSFGRIGTNLTDLRDLTLYGVDMSEVEPVFLMNLSSSSLTSLRIVECGLQGNFPTNIFHLPKLQKLDLAWNPNLIGSLPKYNWSSSLKELRLSGTKFLIDISYLTRNMNTLDSLHLSTCSFVGSYQQLFGNLTNIIELDLSYNNISGQIPFPYWSFQNLERLAYLHLAGNNFIGQIPNFCSHNKSTQITLSQNKSFGPAPWKLEDLDLSDNLLNGTIPNWVYSLPFLRNLCLKNNQFTGHIHEFQTTSLYYLNLKINKLHGSIPVSVFQQVNLGALYLSFNSLSGFVHNHLSLNKTLAFSSVHSNHSLGILPSLQALSLSNNQIQGQVPKWIWNVGRDSLSYLNLSHNSLTNIERIPWKNLQYLDLRSNLLHGQLPIPPPSIRVFLVSHNRIAGEVLSSICNLRSLEILDLANNTLNGKLPPCLGNLTGNLSVLDMRMNKLHGMIPATLFGKKSALRTLNFNGNQLEGLLPSSLLNCEKLQVLDIGNNMINGTFPHWLESLPLLQVLILRSNKFHGSVPNPTVTFPFQKLRILDLSGNEFNGNLPTKLLENLRAMMVINKTKGLVYMGEHYYQDSVFVEMKGNFVELVKILTVFTTIDLSRNNFKGGIPQSIGKLKSLKLLNFSHNKLNGFIPPSLGNLSELESLDLSSNVLVGGIPQQLTDITFLAVLNLSENRLDGRIPRGKQFETFQNNSYGGNLDLCGFPLSKLCSIDDDEAQQPSSPNFEQEGEHELTNGFFWMIVLIGYGCGVVIGISIGYIVLSEKRIAQLMRWVGGERLCKLLKRLKRKAR